MKLKYLIVGFIVGVIAAFSITAGASTVYEKSTAIARPDYKLVVDGEKVTLNNPPKTIEGSTYLPVRELATILGKDVTFKSGTIELKSKVGEKMSTSINVNKIEYVDNDKYDFATDTLLSVKFNVLVETSAIANYKEVDFFRYASDGTTKFNEFIVPQSVFVSPNVETELNILIPVPNDTTATELVFRDPITRQEISINISDL